MKHEETHDLESLERCSEPLTPTGPDASAGESGDPSHDGLATTPLEMADERDAVAPVEVPEGFVVDDEAKAAWAVRKVVEARAYAERVKAWAERELRRAEDEEQWLLRRFGRELEDWARAELARRGGRRRSLPLPGGTVGFRRVPPRVGIVDEVAVAAWCEQQLPDALRVTVEVEGRLGAELLQWHRRHSQDARLRRHLVKERLNRHVAESGELPEGAALVPARDQFYVK